jgi:hypothetical protein
MSIKIVPYGYDGEKTISRIHNRTESQRYYGLLKYSIDDDIEKRMESVYATKEVVITPFSQMTKRETVFKMVYDYLTTQLAKYEEYYSDIMKRYTSVEFDVAGYLKRRIADIEEKYTVVHEIKCEGNVKIEYQLDIPLIEYKNLKSFRSDLSKIVSYQTSIRQVKLDLEELKKLDESKQKDSLSELGKQMDEEDKEDDSDDESDMVEDEVELEKYLDKCYGR